MGKLSSFICLACLMVAMAFSAVAATYEPATLKPPAPPREFRAAWIATVGNIDWPSRKNLTTAEQKAELISILDRSAKLGLNAVIFQVRPGCDALYASTIEPWSEYLTGTMGKAPEPYYDPLSFAVEEAHKRGLELHAWFNPYRARHNNARSPVSANHVSKTQPGLVRSYGSYLWLDPGEPAVREYSMKVVLDVVKRYDVDGVHFDDYFYPYKESANGRELDFPDDASWKKYGAGGKLDRNDWRRENVNRFIERTYMAVKAAKPWVKFGVSPFGIWRPGNPPQIRGFDAYDSLYADARKWLVNGWVDYFVPQLYWGIEPKEQSFPVLLDWWNAQNPKRRHIWPGLDTTKVREQTVPTDPVTRGNARTRPVWNAAEITAQIALTEKQPVSAGHVHWNMKSLLRSTELQAALSRGSYAEPALIPRFPWLDSSSPAKPQVTFTPGTASVKVSWSSGATNSLSAYVFQYKRDGKWATRLLPGTTRSQILDGALPEAIALTAVDRSGNLSAPAGASLKK